MDKVVKGSIDEPLTSTACLTQKPTSCARRRSMNVRRTDRTRRLGHYTRTFHARAGELKLSIPKLRSLPFETSIIERYRRHEVSVEEAPVEMYLAEVSVRRIEDVTQALWGTRVSPSLQTASTMNHKIYNCIEEGVRER